MDIGMMEGLEGGYFRKGVSEALIRLWAQYLLGIGVSGAQLSWTKKRSCSKNGTEERRLGMG